MRINLANARCLVLLTVTLAAAAVVRGSAWASGGDEDQKWEPTRAVARLEDYVGSARCASCHRATFEKQKTTDMGQAAARPAESPLLHAHPVLSFERGSYTYSISNTDGQEIFSVGDVHDKIKEPVYLVIGSGAVYQIYIFQHHGEYFRAPVDYYSASGKLGLEGGATALPASLEAALGERLTAEGVRSCFRCHSPASVVGDRPDIERTTPGVTCEACHGPGAQHVAAMKAGKPQESRIFNPAHLKPEEQLDFCGACHHSAQEVKNGSLRGLRTVISQDYRLTGSRCWNSADRRSECVFCHDPHAPRMREISAYDARCLSCHVTSAGVPVSADRPGRPCPVGHHDCAGCHMPKVSVPGSPVVFTDHRIRIARAGEPYPE